MNLIQSILFGMFLLQVTPMNAQKKNLSPNGGEGFPRQVTECITDELHERIRLESISNMKRLGIFQEDNQERNMMLVALNWPLAQATGFNDNGYCAITNYIDQDPSSGILDYNCGNRTYNGHKGIDIMLFPFRWNMQIIGQVNVIASHTGTVIYKVDGYSDMNCSCSSTNWNAVLIQHSDGSIAWYGHLKNGSTTSKVVGQTVTQGEYLGKVGSSGCSTDPHLHYELYGNSNQTNLIDPYAGTCNALNGSISWWTSQKPYRTPTLHKLMTHDCNPSQNFGCPANNDVMCAQNNLSAGNLTRFSAHYSDQTINTVTDFEIKRPDGTIWNSWNFNSPNTYNYGSWWYWNYNIPTSEPSGVWTYEATYEGQTVIHSFIITGGTLPIELINFEVEKLQERNKISWMTATESNNSHFIVEKSNDGLIFSVLTEIKGNGTTSKSNYYSALDNTPYSITYYRLVSVDFDGTKYFSKIIVVEKEIKDDWIKISNYDSGEVKIQITDNQLDMIQIELFDVTGKLLFQTNLDNENSLHSINTSTLSNGIYVIKASSGNRIFSQRFVKE